MMHKFRIDLIVEVRGEVPTLDYDGDFDARQAIRESLEARIISAIRTKLVTGPTHPDLIFTPMSGRVVHMGQFNDDK